MDGIVYIIYDVSGTIYHISSQIFAVLRQTSGTAPIGYTAVRVGGVLTLGVVSVQVLTGAHPVITGAVLVCSVRVAQFIGGALVYAVIGEIVSGTVDGVGIIVGSGVACAVIGTGSGIITGSMIGGAVGVVGGIGIGSGAGFVA